MPPLPPEDVTLAAVHPPPDPPLPLPFSVHVELIAEGEPDAAPPVAVDAPPLPPIGAPPPDDDGDAPPIAVDPPPPPRAHA